MDKEQAKNKLKELVDQFSQASKNNDYISSQNGEWIKWNFLEPLLGNVLGWKKSDIEKEKKVLRNKTPDSYRIAEALVNNYIGQVLLGNPNATL